MQRLSGLDAAFLALETPNSTGHVGGLSIVDAAGASRSLDLALLTGLMTQRLPLVPLLRQRLLTVPLGIDQPYWIDDPDFDIEYHVREIALPRPGSQAQLTEQVARLHARPLDRRRPLWEAYLITGLSHGQAAVYTKIHHAAIDGVSGAELLTALMDLTPDGRAMAEQEPYEPSRPPSRLSVGVKAATRLAWRPVEVTRLVVGAARAVPGLAPAVGPLLGGLVRTGMGDGAVIPTTIGRAPTTPFNAHITPHRRIALRSMDLQQVKHVKATFGVSVNDVVMAMCAGALRRWLIEHDALPDTPLVAMVPVSVRDESNKSGPGNKVSAMLATLPTHVEDPVQRLTVAHEATTVAKAQQAFIPAGLVEDIQDFAPPAVVARAARVVFASRVLNRVPMFNLTISNVPGPNIPAYIAGARVVAHYPVSVVTEGQALNITLIGYLGQLHFGLVSCREVVPDLDSLAGYLTDELALLVKAAGVAAGKPERPPRQQRRAVKKPGPKG